MKHINYIFVLLALVILSPACKSGKKMMEKGQYDNAVITAVHRLQQSPTNKKASATLQEAYPLAVQYHLDRIATAKTSDNMFKWEDVMAEYNALNSLYDNIQKSPAAQKLVNETRYTTELADAKSKAAEVRYANGNKFLEKKNKADAKTAYNNFEIARNIMGGSYKDCDTKMNEAMDYAITKVIVLPVEVHSNALKMSNDYFQNKIVQYLYEHRISKFVMFYSEAEAKKLNVRTDEILDLSFDDFVVGQLILDRLQREVQNDSAVLGTNKLRTVDGKRDSSSNIYGKAKATLFITKKTILSSGVLDMKVVDRNSNAIMLQDKFPGSYTWINQFGYYQGDERALSNDDRNLLKGKELTPPPPQELFYEFTRPIFDQLITRITQYYSNY